MAAEQDFQGEVGQWADFLLAHATPQTFAAKIAEEAAELILELGVLQGEGWAASNMDALRNEAADLYIVLTILATYFGFDLLAAARSKHARNATRKWGPPDANGVIKHIKEE